MSPIKPASTNPASSLYGSCAYTAPFRPWAWLSNTMAVPSGHSTSSTQYGDRASTAVKTACSRVRRLFYPRKQSVRQLLNTANQKDTTLPTDNRSAWHNAHRIVQRQVAWIRNAHLVQNVSLSNTPDVLVDHVRSQRCCQQP